MFEIWRFKFYFHEVYFFLQVCYITQSKWENVQGPWVVKKAKTTFVENNHKREVCIAYYMQHIGNISDDRFFPLGSWVVRWGWGKFWLAVAKVEKGQLCLDNAFKSQHVLREPLLSKCASFIIYCTHFWMNTVWTIGSHFWQELMYCFWHMHSVFWQSYALLTNFLKTYSRLNDAEHFFWMLVFVFICPPISHYSPNNP